MCSKTIEASHQTKTSDTHSRPTINWLAIMRGMTIVLVVMNHAKLLNLSTGDNYAFIDSINEWFLPLRMPTFVMVSGALLYYTRIMRGWTTASLYRDKLVRIGLPLLFCTCLGNVMQIIFNGFVKTPHEVTPASFLLSFITFDGMPWGHRWYLMTLLTMMALYPLITRIRHSWLAGIVLLVLLALQRADLTYLSETNWCYLFCLNRYLPFFYLGIVSVEYHWWDWVKQRCVLLLPLTVVTYVALYHLNAFGFSAIDEHLPLGELLGMMVMVSASMTVDKFLPSACSTFRKYIFQIYLFGIAFQAFVELIVWRKIGCPGSLAGVFFVLNILAGVYLPVLMAKVVECLPWRIVRLCFGLK